MTDILFKDEICNNLASEISREYTQKSFADAVELVFNDYRQPTLLNVIPPDNRVEYADIGMVDLLYRTLQMRKRLATILPPDVLFAGSLDISLNISSNSERYWCLHYHGILSDKLNPRELEKLKEAYPRNPKLGLFKPVIQKLVAQGELRSTAEYCYKRFFTRRSSYIAKPKSGRDPYWDSRSQTLSRADRELLKVAQMKCGVCAPIILVGLKRMRTSNPAEVRLMRTRQ